MPKLTGDSTLESSIYVDLPGSSEPGEDEPKPLPVDPTPNHGPQTEDFIIQSVAILIVSVLGLFLAIIFLRRSKKDDAEEDKE